MCGESVSTEARPQNDDTDVAIVRGIIALAHNLDLQVVAEGVETAPQRELLERMGCDIVQGYLISRPLPAEDLTARFLADQAPQPGRRPRRAGATK